MRCIQAVIAIHHAFWLLYGKTSMLKKQNMVNESFQDGANIIKD